MKRRDFLKLSTISIPSLSLLGCNDDNNNNNDVTVVTDNTTVTYNANDVRSSAAKRVYVSDNAPYTMNVKYANAGTVNGIPLNYRTFNGKFPPDTLVVKPGDTLKITFNNNLPASAEDNFYPNNTNMPHGFNNTNLHTHGLNVSPRANEDDVLHTVHPGEIFEYAIHIPNDHPAGLFWYHPHKHGSALHQIASGMCGYLIVEDGAGDLNQIPEIAAAEDVELSFHELIVGITADNLGQTPAEGIPGIELIDPTDFTSWNTYSRNPIHSLFTQQAYLQYTLNGKAVDEGVQRDANGLVIPGTAIPPEITMRPGELQRWRFGILGHLQTYRFALVNANDASNTDRIPLRVAAWDGITADKITEHDELVMGPADRVDWLIKAPSTPGTYQLKMLFEQFGAAGDSTNPNVNAFPVAFDENGIPTFWLPAFTTPSVGGTELAILTLKIEGEPNDMPLPASLNPPRERLPYITDSEISRRRTIKFKVSGEVSINFSGNSAEVPIIDNRQFTVNDLPFDASRVNETMLLGSAEEWTITNVQEGQLQFKQINHPFHIHVNWLQVMEIWHPIKDATGAHILDSSGNPTFNVEKPNNGEGRWMDTIDVPHGGKTVIRHRFEKFTGIFPFHCHVIAHEDEGMMHVCEVIDPTPIVQTMTVAEGGMINSRDKISNQSEISRVIINFPANSFTADTSINYFPELDPKHALLAGKAGLERYFAVTGVENFTGTATITVQYAALLSRGNNYDAATVKLYRSNGTDWVETGITILSDDQTTKVLTATLDASALSGQYFAVMATETSAAIAPAYT